MAKAGIVYVGGDDGVVIFSDPASIGRWRRVGHELQGRQVRAIVAHSALRVDLAAAAEGVQHSEDGGQSWHQTSSGNAVALAAHPAAPATLFLASADGQVQRSDNAGQSWQPCPQGGRPTGAAICLLIDPLSAQRLLLAQPDGVWQSANGGQTWQALGTGLPGGITGMAISPQRVHTLWVAAGDAVWRAGESGLWAQTGGGLPLGSSGALALLPGNVEVLLAASASPDGAPGLARSEDAGESWQLASTDAPLEGQITVIVPATYHLDTAWAGSAGGQLLRSDDRGRSWQLVAHGLAAVRTLAAVRLA